MDRRSSEVSLALQAFSLRQFLPGSTIRVGPQHLTWRGRVQPLPSAGTYSLELRAGRLSTPTVRVLAPDLVPDGSGRLPHVYDDGSLCLGQPGEWNRSMFFVDTLVPWAFEWLVYYELWRATGTWMGDGEQSTDDASQAAILHPYASREAATRRRSRDRESVRRRRGQG